MGDTSQGYGWSDRHEWDFGDVNPPVHAWAALQVFAIDGARDLGFLGRVFDKLLVNFAWWVNMEDAGGNNVFEGGFLGLDNIGPIDRSHLPPGYVLEQSDATGWMGAYALAMGAIAAILNWSGQREGQDLILKFLEHFAGIRNALDQQHLWDDADGLFYDRLITPFRPRRPGQGPVHGRDHPGAGRGLRAVSAYHRDHPYQFNTEGFSASIDLAWHDNLIFSEYFHGDNGAAIGAFHQTGWTGLIADLILRRHGAVRAIGDVLRDLSSKAQR